MHPTFGSHPSLMLICKTDVTLWNIEKKYDSQHPTMKLGSLTDPPRSLVRSYSLQRWGCGCGFVYRVFVSIFHKSVPMWQIVMFYCMLWCFWECLTFQPIDRSSQNPFVYLFLKGRFYREIRWFLVMASMICWGFSRWAETNLPTFEFRWWEFLVAYSLSSSNQICLKPCTKHAIKLICRKSGLEGAS